MTSSYVPAAQSNAFSGNISTSGAIEVGDAPGQLAATTGLIPTRAPGYSSLAPGLQLCFDADGMPGLYAHAFQHDDIKLVFDGYDATTSGLGTYSSSANGTFALAKRANTFSLAAGFANPGSKLSFTTALSSDSTGFVTIPNLQVPTLLNVQSGGTLNTLVGTTILGATTITSAPVESGAVHIWVKTLPLTTLAPNALTQQPITPYTTTYQLNGPHAASTFFNANGQFTPPVKGVWHFGSFLRVQLPATVQYISQTFQLNATDGVTNMLSSTTIPCTGVNNQGMYLSGTALIGPSDYVNMVMYVNGTGTVATDITNGQTNFVATLIARTS